MGKKGSSKTVYQERPQSAQELRLLETQNQMMQQGINIGQQQEDRSQAMYEDWKNNYQGIETGQIRGNAERANGYSQNPNIMSKEDYSKFKTDYDTKMAALRKELEGLQPRRRTAALPAPTTETTSNRWPSGSPIGQLYGLYGLTSPRLFGNRG